MGWGQLTTTPGPPLCPKCYEHPLLVTGVRNTPEALAPLTAFPAGREQLQNQR